MDHAAPPLQGKRAPDCHAARTSTGWRCFEVIACSLGLIVALPILGAAAVAIKIEDGGPVLFRQVRVGRNGATFHLFKLRSMGTGPVSGALVTAAGDKRITRVGRVLRKYKLDEIPQLWNVMRSEMSLVGPRPEVPRYVDESDSRWREILQLRPGITDLATLLHRDEERLLAAQPDPEEYYRRSILPAKLSLNLEYMQTSTCGRDLKLILLSVVFSVWPSGMDAARLREEFLSKATT